MITLKSIILGFSLLIAATVAQEINAMRQATKALKEFGKHSATLATGVACSFFAYDQYIRKERMAQRYQNISQDAQRDPQPKTEAFVLDVLRKAYPELKDRTIEVIAKSHNLDKSFSVTTLNKLDRIYVPFGDKDLEIARDRKNNHLEIAVEDIAEYLKKKNSPLSIPEYIAKQEGYGKAMQPSTLDSWHCTILHEGSHIAYNDAKTRHNVSYAMTPIALLACLKSMHKFSAPLLLTALGATFAIPHALECWAEYRADQQAIKRSEDPALLHAKSEYFANQAKENISTFSEKVNYYLDPHPSDQTRAVYFKEAANELTKKLAKD